MSSPLSRTDPQTQRSQTGIHSQGGWPGRKENMQRNKYPVGSVSEFHLQTPVACHHFTFNFLLLVNNYDAYLTSGSYLFLDGYLILYII